MIKKKDVSRTLCETSKEYIKKLTQANDKKTIKTKQSKTSKKSKTSNTSKTSKTSNKITYTKYNNYIKKIVKSFVNSQHTLLDTIFKIKKECQFDITYQEEMLYNTTTNTIK